MRPISPAIPTKGTQSWALRPRPTPCCFSLVPCVVVPVARLPSAVNWEYSRPPSSLSRGPTWKIRRFTVAMKPLPVSKSPAASWLVPEMRVWGRFWPEGRGSSRRRSHWARRGADPRPKRTAVRQSDNGARRIKAPAKPRSYPSQVPVPHRRVTSPRPAFEEHQTIHGEGDGRRGRERGHGPGLPPPRQGEVGPEGLGVEGFAGGRQGSAQVRGERRQSRAGFQPQPEHACGSGGWKPAQPRRA